MAKMDWKENLCYSTPTYYEYSVNGKLQKFYPVSVNLLFQLRRTATNAVKAVSEIFADIKKDTKTIDNTVTQSNAQGGVQRTVVLEPIKIDLAQYRDKQRSEAWANMVNALTDVETLRLLAEIIMDSMKEVFAESKPTPDEFLRETKLPTLVQMVIGTAKGNQDVLGPLGPKVSSFLATWQEAATTKLAELTADKEKEKPKSAA